MILTTFDSAACYLLTCDEVWGKSITGEFATRSASDAGLSNREGRRALATETILALAYQLYSEGAEAAQIRAALRAYNNEPLLVPLWPADCLLADRASCRWTGGLRLFYELGMTAWQVRAGATEPDSFVPTADCRTVPLLWARFDKLPLPEAADGNEAMEVTITAIENGLAEYAIRATGVTLRTGPMIGALTPKLLSIIPDWENTVAAGGIDLRIDRDRIGYGRGEAEEYVNQEARGRQKVSFPLLGDEIAQLAMLHRVVGTVGSFWVPGAFAEARLVAAITAGNVIQVDNPSVLADLDYIALVDGDTVAACKILSREGNALTLQSAPGVFAAGTAVCSLLLARFAANKLKITWKTPTVATASVEVIELPTETTVPAGETVGTTIGNLGAKWWGYVVTMEGGGEPWRYTSYERAIDAGALGIFTPPLPGGGGIDHGDLTMELNLVRHDMEFTCAWWPDSPFWWRKTDPLAPTLTVQVYEGTLANPAAAECIHTGDFLAPSYQGKKCTAKLAGLTALLDMKGPIGVTSPRCWVPMYSPLCGLSREALGVPAELAGYSGSSLNFGVSAPPDQYRGGYAERVCADGRLMRYAIVGSGGDGVVIPPLGEVQGEVTAWAAGVAAAGGTLSLISERVANSLVQALKGTSFFTKIRYLLPLLGANTAAAMQPLIDPAAKGRPVSTFGGSDYSEPAGLTGDGIGKRLQLPFSGADLGSGGNGGIGFWVLGSAPNRGDGTNSGPVGFVGNDGVSGYGISVVTTTRLSAFHWGAFSHSVVASSAAPVVGDFYGQRSSSVDRRFFLGGVQLGQNTVSDTATQGADRQIWAWARNHTTVNHWSGRGGCVYLTDGTLTVAEVGQFHAILTQYLMQPTGRLASGIVLDRPLALAPAQLPESGWTLYPGCDQSPARCKALGNSENFRGCPHFPKTNPAMVSVKQETASGSKK